MFDGLVHSQRRERVGWVPHLPRWDSCHGAMRRNILEDDAASADLGAFPDDDTTQHLRACADHAPSPDLRRAVAVDPAGASQGYLVQHREVVFDNGGLADDNAGGVVESA